MNPERTEPDNRLVQAQLALLRADLPTARALCNQVLDTDPGWPAALGLMGRIEEAAGRPDEALHWVAAAAQRDPDNPVWSEARDKLVRQATNRQTPRPKSAETPQPTESPRLPVSQTFRELPNPIRIALFAGAALALALGVAVGLVVSGRPDPIPRPDNPPAAAPTTPAPIVVDTPKPPPSTAVQNTQGAPATPATPQVSSPPQTPPISPPNPATPPSTPANSDMEVMVENAREARWNPANATLSVWITLPLAPPLDDQAKGQIRNTAETVVRNALGRFPEAKRVRVRVEQSGATGDGALLLDADGEVPADPGAKQPILAREAWAGSNP